MNKVKASVKDLEIFEDSIRFYFSDRYSIFDWGEMPDAINGKGLALLSIASYFDELLKSKKIKTATTKITGNFMEQKKFPIHKPELQEDGTYSYKKLDPEKESFLIPLEVIFRYSLPKGNSLIKRKPEAEKLCNNKGDLKNIYIEFSTKLESYDRYMEDSEALAISSLSEEQFEKLKYLVIKAAETLKEDLANKSLKLLDGKFELAWDSTKQELVFIDSIGIDELRIAKNDLILSKEYLRNLYRDSIWHQQLLAFKEQSTDWKAAMLDKQILPRPLPKELKKAAEDLYRSASNIICNNKNFDESKLSYFQEKKKVLVLGDGGREHGICKSLNYSPLASEIFLSTKKSIPYSEAKITKCLITDADTCLAFCLENLVDLVVIGPEAFLELGYADHLREHGVKVFGPSKAATKIESSKDYSKNLMREAGIPTASFKSFNNIEQARDYINESITGKMVVKADGLASGKGVFVCDSKDEALSALSILMEEKSIPGGESIVIEERMEGPEFSAFAFFDESGYRFIGTASDYKRIYDGDQGPNTGGMGSYSPSDWLADEDLKFTKEMVFNKLHHAFAKNKIQYRGVVFAGLMKTNKGIKVIEFNARFGDPETQSLLPRLESDLFYFMDKCADGKLSETEEVAVSNRNSLHLVFASGGYPGISGEPMSTGHEIKLPGNINPDKLFYAGLDLADNKLLNTGGRVLGYTAFGKNRKEAMEKAYLETKEIQFKDMQKRSDIGIGPGERDS